MYQRQPPLVRVYGPVRHVLAADLGADAAEVLLEPVVGHGVRVLRVDDVGEHRGRRERAGYGRERRHRRAHDLGLGLAARGVVVAAGLALVHVAAVLLDDEVRGHEADDLGDLDLHLGHLRAAVGAFRLLDLVLDDDALQVRRVYAPLAAAPAGLRGGGAAGKLRLGLGRVGPGLGVVEQGQVAEVQLELGLVGGGLLGLGGEEPQVGELDLLDEARHLGLQPGDPLRHLGRRGAALRLPRLPSRRIAAPRDLSYPRRRHGSSFFRP